MTRPTVIALKTLTWTVYLLPAARIVWGAVANTLGADPTAEIASITGLSALWILAASLAITPLRKLWSRLAWLIQLRRLLGLFVFFYASLHMLTYVALYAVFDPHAIVADITKRRFILMGMTTWLLLLPLAVTSTTWAIRKLGGRRWNRLHKLVYLAAVCAMIHYWWKVKPGVLSPVPFTMVLLVLLAARPALAWAQRRKVRARVAA